MVDRRREDVRSEPRLCVVCDEERPSVLYRSWRPAGLLGRHREDERSTWRCTVCGTRTPATGQHRAPLGATEA